MKTSKLLQKNINIQASPVSAGQDDDDEEFAPENVTFAPKDVNPVDFSPRVGVQGLGYHGLDPGLALLGREASEHINLFRPESETRSQLFGDTQRGSRRAGVAGQVGFVMWMLFSLTDVNCP